MGIVRARFSESESLLLKNSAQAHKTTKAELVRGLIWQAIQDNSVSKYRRLELVPMSKKRFPEFQAVIPDRVLKQWRWIVDRSCYANSNLALRSLVWAYPLIEVDSGEWVLPAIEYPSNWAIKRYSCQSS